MCSFKLETTQAANTIQHCPKSHTAQQGSCRQHHAVRTAFLARVTAVYRCFSSSHSSLCCDSSNGCGEGRADGTARQPTSACLPTVQQHPWHFTRRGISSCSGTLRPPTAQQATAGAHQRVQARAREAQLRGRHLRAAAAVGTLNLEMVQGLGCTMSSAVGQPLLLLLLLVSQAFGSSAWRRASQPLLGTHVYERLLKGQPLGALLLLKRLHLGKVLQAAVGRYWGCQP